MRRFSAYRVFLTQKSEYHIRGHACFGVRDRRTGEWMSEHWALGHQLATAFANAHGHAITTRLPAITESLSFMIDGALHYTSPILAIEEREHLDRDALSPLLRSAGKRPPGKSRETF